MKQQVVLFSYVLLLYSFLVSARLLVPPKQGCSLGVNRSPPSPSEQLDICEKEDKANVVAVARSSTESEDDDMELMGAGECDEKNQEWFSRRMIAEAHLDSIYTKHLP